MKHWQAESDVNARLRAEFLSGRTQGSEASGDPWDRLAHELGVPIDGADRPSALVLSIGAFAALVLIVGLVALWLGLRRRGSAASRIVDRPRWVGALLAMSLVLFFVSVVVLPWRYEHHTYNDGVIEQSGPFALISMPPYRARTPDTHYTAVTIDYERAAFSIGGTLALVIVALCVRRAYRSALSSRSIAATSTGLTSQHAGTVSPGPGAGGG